jgi:beta-glucosidase
MALALVLSACRADSVTPTAAPHLTASTAMPYRDSSLPIDQRVADLLARMTLPEKIGQMTQVEKNSLQPADITGQYLGSILSGGGGHPAENTPTAWARMTDGFQHSALATRLGLPLIYGVDAVHGHNNLYGATLFPHNIGLGATRDADLVERIGRATAEEMLATGIRWDFAPVVAVPQDIRWGRTYEGYSENTGVVTQLGVAYLRGLQSRAGGDSLTVLATPKHFIGDGGTTWGTSSTNILNHAYRLDQGDMRTDESVLRELYLPPYTAAIEAGAQSIMVSFSSWNGTKMHAQKYLLTDVLKGELGFTGFLVSDWQAIDRISSDYTQAVVTSINAGLDMIMVPYDYHRFIATLTQAVNSGAVPLARIDDAVSRILRVKFALGLFEHPYSDPATLTNVGSDAHRALAREAVRKSLVLLKNDQAALPLAKNAPVIFVAGNAANDIGMQSGGWTIEWQGGVGNITLGTTILQGIQQAVSPDTRVEFNRLGHFEALTDAQGQPLWADVGIVVLGEEPYAEGVGDSEDLTLNGSSMVDRMRERCHKLVLVVVSGRPLIVSELLSQVDALVAAWLPGTEGQGVTDVLFGDYDFTGKLPYTWPRSNAQLPLNSNMKNLPTGCAGPLFTFGYGLTTKDPSPEILECP